MTKDPQKPAEKEARRRARRKERYQTEPKFREENLTWTADSKKKRRERDPAKGLLGVVQHPSGKFAAYGGKRLLGLYATMQDAAIAHDLAVIQGPANRRTISAVNCRLFGRLDLIAPRSALEGLFPATLKTEAALELLAWWAAIPPGRRRFAAGKRLLRHSDFASS